jgi:RNA polymerase sigma factor (sigma-70 family)
MQASASTVQDLVVAAQAGDHGAWRELMVRYDRMVRGAASAFRFQDADVADVAQATWLSAFEQLGALRQPERFGGWLRTIVRNECRDVYWRADRERPADQVGAVVEEPSPGPEALALQCEIVRAIRDAVGDLPDRSQVLVEHLYFAPECGYASVAQVTGMPLGSVGPTRSRVLVVLRNRLERRGFGPDRAVARAG